MPESLENVVSELDRELLRNHRHDTVLFEQLTEIQRSSGILHGDRAICPFLRPFFLAESTYDSIRNAAALIYGAFTALTKAALENDAVLDELGVSEKEARWAKLDPRYLDVSVNSRLDTFLSPDGFAFLEYNGENPAGIGDQASLENLFTHIPTVKRFLNATKHYFPKPQERLLHALDQSYIEFGGKKELPNIAIVDWAGVSTGAEFEILKDHFESQGYPTKICDPYELDYRKGSLVSGDFEIDVFFKRVIIHEFLDRFDEAHPVYQAIADGSVCMANSFRSKIPHKKASLAVLTDERYRDLFTPEQLDAIARHVPWTRNVREGTTLYDGEEKDLIEFIRAERHRFVLKPNDDYGGKGISFGWECSVSEWDVAIESALASTYVVQERVPVEKVNIPVYFQGEAKMESLTVDFDPFLFRGIVEGGMVRLASGSLVNISSGGAETALAILRGY